MLTNCIEQNLQTKKPQRYYYHPRVVHYKHQVENRLYYRHNSRPIYFFSLCIAFVLNFFDGSTFRENEGVAKIAKIRPTRKYVPLQYFVFCIFLSVSCIMPIILLHYLLPIIERPVLYM